jgi:hypothetical protein
MKLTPGVDFTNIIQAAFTYAEKSANRQPSCQSFLRFWDLRAQNMLIAPGVDFTNILQAAFYTKIPKVQKRHL